MKKNDLVSICIEDFTSEGLGIGHAGSLAVFVKDAVIGDELSVRITKLKKNYAFGRIESILKPSPDRVRPLCPDAVRCGGCQIQMMNYEAQLAFKEAHVRNCLERIGGQSSVKEKMSPIIGMKEPWRYRNKAQYPVGTDRDGRLISGFYAGRTHSIIPQEDCRIGNEQDGKIRRIVLEWMQENSITSYNEETCRGTVRHIMIRHAKNGQALVCLVLHEERAKNEEDLVRRLAPFVASISINVNKQNTNVIFGDQTRVLYGSGSIEDQIENIRYQISPRSFYQVNPEQTEKLYRTALEYAGLTGTETVWDLYCGIGTISLFLAQKAGKVCGVEIIPEAVEDARENARRNSIDNAVFFTGKAEEILPEQYREHRAAADVIVVDPPRKGCDEALLQTMLNMQPRRIVYVSCDPATLARDVKILSEGGYELKKVQPVDMFPHSVHVETVCLLIHKD